MATADRQFWACPVCTFHNSLDQTQCAMCHTTHVPTFDQFGKWTCSACTFVNESYKQTCTICFKKRTKPDSSISADQWICVSCHFWNEQQNDQCFKCLTNRYQNSGNSGKQKYLKTQASKDDSDLPDVKSPNSKKTGFKVFDKFIAKQDKKANPTTPKHTDDLRSSLRAGDLILWQPDKLNPKSKSNTKDKLNSDMKEVPNLKDRKVGPSIPKSRKAKRDKRMSGVGWTPKVPSDKTKNKQAAFAKDSGMQEVDVQDDLVKRKRDDLRSSRRAGDLIIWHPDGKFDKKPVNSKDMMKNGSPGIAKFQTPGNDKNQSYVILSPKVGNKKSQDILAKDIQNQMLDRMLNQQGRHQYPISKPKTKDDLRSSRRAGDLIIWDPNKSKDLETNKAKKVSHDIKIEDIKKDQEDDVVKPYSPKFDRRHLITKQATRKEADISDDKWATPSLKQLDIDIKDRLRMFEQDKSKDIKPKRKDDLRSSRRAGDLFIWQPDKQLDPKPQVKPTSPQVSSKTKETPKDNGGIKNKEEKVTLLIGKRPIAQPRTSLRDKQEGIDGNKDKSDDRYKAEDKKENNIIGVQNTTRKTITYNAVDNIILKIEQDPIPKIKRKDDLRSSRSAGDLIIWQPNRKLDPKYRDTDIPKSKYSDNVISKDVPKSKNIPISKTKNIQEAPVTPLKPKTPGRIVTSKNDSDKPETVVGGKTPKSNSKEYRVLDKLIKGLEKDPEPKPKFKDDLRSSLRAGDLFVWDPDKKINQKGKKGDNVKQKVVPIAKDSAQLREKKQWVCSLCSEKNDPTKKVCHRCLSQKPDMARKSRHSKMFRKRLLASRKSMKAVDVRKKEEQEAMTKWANIVQFCKQRDGKFTDDKFPPHLTSLYVKSYPGRKNPKWLRCESLRNEDKEDNKLEWTVYRKPTTPEDIMQGTLGNCWYLSALAVLAYREDLLEKIIVTKLYCYEGAYMVRLCKDGYWKIILIDDLFPSDEYDRLLYSRAKRRQLWVPLIEKAAAKLHGCYEALTSGRTIEALSLLTGEPCERIDLHETDDGSPIDKDGKEKVWSKLVHARESGFLMGSSCGSGKMKNVDYEHYKTMGLISQHAYSLLDVQDVERNRLVKIRNPWGKDSWKGNWCDISSKWNGISNSRKSDLKPDGNNNGIFWMDFYDYIRYFDSVDICKARRDWQELRLKGIFPPHAAEPWKFYKLGIIADTQIDIGLFQKSMRGTGLINEPLVDLLIVVLEDTEDGFGFKRVVKHSPRALRSFVGCEVSLKPGKYTIACLAFKHWHTTVGMSQDDLDQLNRDFVLTVHSSMMIFTDEIDTRSLPGYKYLLADAVIRLAMDKGTKQELQPGLITYSLSLGGGIFVLENSTTDKFARMKCDYSKSSYLVASRGNFVTKDCVPPRHRQILAVLSPLDPSAGWSSQRNISYLLHRKKGLQEEWAPPGVEHVPDITNELSAMYSPRPID